MVELSDISFINVIALLYLYPSLIIEKQCITACIVLINGLLFHTHRKNNYLFMYDMIFNILLILYENYHNPEIRLLSTVGSIVSGSNTILYRTYNYNRHIADIIHILSTTYVGYVCLKMIYV